MKSNIVVIKEKGIALVFARNGKGKFAIINYDEELIKEVSRYTWTCVSYNKTKEYFKTGRNNYCLHHLVMEHYHSKETGMVIDHINNNGIDCRVENLHYLTRGENSSKQYIDGR